MTTSKELYTAKQTYNYSTLSHSSGFFTSRRPYDLEEMFNYKEHKNIGPTFKTLVGGKSFTLSCNANDYDHGWHEIKNVQHMIKTSTSSKVNYAYLYWRTSTNTYRNTIGVGGGFGEDSYHNYGYYLPNVIGMSFTWRREGDWDRRFIGCRVFGINFYSPRQNAWRSVRFTPASEWGNKGYLSPEGDYWHYRDGNMADVAGGEDDSNWNPVQGVLSDDAQKMIFEDDWLLGGFFFEVKAEGKGGQANQDKIFKISDVQPIFGPYYASNTIGPRTILPAPKTIDPTTATEGRYLYYP